jgi:sulfonate transport system substrate-binding protein
MSSLSLDEHALDQIFRSARSIHAFQPIPVTDATLQTLYELLKWGPTAFNAQPARYVFVCSDAGKARLIPTLSEASTYSNRWYCPGAWIFASLLLFAALAHADGLVLRIGDSKGLYKALLTAAGELKDLSYTVEWAEFPATAPALEALAAGAIDLRGSAAAPLIFAVAAGAPIKAVAGLRLDGRRESVAILVPSNSSIRTVEDLRGKRVGTNKGSVGHHLVLAALQRAKIPFGQVTIQYLLPSDAKAALGGGSVDAWSTWDPYVSIAEVQDHLRPIVDGSDLPMSDGTLVASSAAISAKRALLSDFIARQARAQDWARAHSEAYAKLYADQTGLSIEVTRSVVKHMNYRYVRIDDSIIRDHQEVADLYLKAAVIRQPVEVSVVFDRTVFK